ncbi:uncharacterized protein LOC128869503 [Anastrepha ludens]|uniref:uncharacterized protein LOC128869503 n=1 Tax=Anastrepha ludens TaxID=28586 RepID=UPI0023B09500|nr:uncharacterized protein LOC128869503 [Anastrepha ludens]
MICDPTLKILNVNAKFPGARHDSYIWSSSAVRMVMQRNFEIGNHNLFLIGDSGYPLEPWLMTPLTNQPEGTPKFLYNEALCKARNPVERLFGVPSVSTAVGSTLPKRPGFISGQGLSLQQHSPYVNMGNVYAATTTTTTFWRS